MKNDSTPLKTNPFEKWQHATCWIDRLTTHRHQTSIIGCLLMLALAGCNLDIHTRQHADTIFFGQHILTMDDSRVEAVAIQGERILATGTRAQIQPYIGRKTELVELGEKALLPGFIDAHGHLGATARLADLINIWPPPAGTIESIDDLLSQLRHEYERRPPGPGEWLVAYGYDDSLLQEKRHPTREDLDTVSTTTPILIVHVSGHLGVLNSSALEASDISAETSDPAGGLIRRQANSREPNGVMEGAAINGVMAKQLSDINPFEFAAMLKRAFTYYASYGITTIQDGGTSPEAITGMKLMAYIKTFPIDVAAYHRLQPDQLTDNISLKIRPNYLSGFRVAGIKISIDGSPQGRTAWMTTPYQQLPEGVDADYVAYPTVVPEEFVAKVSYLIKADIPLMVHTNGDAAIDLLIKAVNDAQNDQPNNEHRTVAIHAQLMRADQLDAARELGILPSFFSSHAFYWGDWHLLSFGEQRGNNISPTGWATERNVRFTIHNDAPVVPPDMMRLVWATVNRTTRSGITIGANQKIDVMTALKAITIDAAYQYFEEDNKGSITPGKQSDLVILERNPLLVAPESLDKLKVLETIARGKTVFELTE